MDKKDTSPESRGADSNKPSSDTLKKIPTGVVVAGVLAAMLLLVGVDGVMTEMRKNDSVAYSDSDIISDSAAEAEEVMASAEVPLSDPQSFPMDINAAEKQHFMSVNGIGEKTADDIIAFRDSRGVITSIDQLAEIRGIGESMIAILKQYFYVADDVYLPYTEQSETSVVTTAETETSERKSSRQTSRRTTTRRTTERPRTEPKTDTQTEPQENLDTETATELDPTGRERVPVDINHASASEISECLLLPIEKAEDIVSLRETIHYFSDVAELYLVESLTKQDIMDITDYIIILPL